MENENLKNMRTHKREKYLRTDKKKRIRFSSCDCPRCNVALAKKITNEKYIKKLKVELKDVDKN